MSRKPNQDFEVCHTNKNSAKRVIIPLSASLNIEWMFSIKFDLIEYYDYMYDIK